MATSLTPNLGLNKLNFGDPGWQALLNGNADILDRLAASNLIRAVTGGTLTLTALEAMSSSFEFSGALTANQIVVMPNTVKPVLIENLTTGAFTLTAKTAAGAGVVVGQGAKALVYGNGTNIEEIVQNGVVTNLVSNANQVLASTAITKTILAGVGINAAGNIADTANSRVTINVPGLYAIRANSRALTTAAIQGLTQYIYVNGGVVNTGNMGYNNVAAQTYVNSRAEVEIQLAAGAFVESYVAATLAGGLTLISGDCNLLVEKK